jgi:hypothetical protein
MRRVPLQGDWAAPLSVRLEIISVDPFEVDFPLDDDEREDDWEEEEEPDV